MSLKVGMPAIALAVGGWLLFIGPHWPGEKLSASQTAGYLSRESPNWRDVRCAPSGDAGWDYRCSFATLYEGKRLAAAIDVRVDTDKVTSQSAP